MSSIFLLYSGRSPLESRILHFVYIVHLYCFKRRPRRPTNGEETIIFTLDKPVVVQVKFPSLVGTVSTVRVSTRELVTTGSSTFPVSRPPKTLIKTGTILPSFHKTKEKSQ